MLKGTLLATKLHQPALPAGWIRRPQQLSRLSQGFAQDRPLTLVSAPAGFGKTTCACAWIQSLADRPVTWLSLDPADDDPARFLVYCVAALQQIEPALGRDVAGALQSGRLPASDAVAASLIDDILALEQRFVLVLDDFHLIQNSFILAVLEQVLTNPPAPLHLVLLTREDPPLPLARWRANNLLTEIRAADLRFSPQDSARFLNETMGLALSETDVNRLDKKTEGWIAGLQLAALALQTAPSGPSALISALSGSHRYILSYLTEQVLDRQPEAMRHFLLQTSILTHLNGDLCAAVTGRQDSHMLLERLHGADLFLIPLDHDGCWYRYHHLFADLLGELRRTLPQEEIEELHRRAGCWFADQDGVRFVDEAMTHALAGSDYDTATALLERHARTIVGQGYAGKVNEWVKALPEAYRSQSIGTHLALAWMHFLRGAYAAATPHLEQAEAALNVAGQTAETASLRGEWLALQALQQQLKGNLAQSERLAEQALTVAPAQGDHARGLGQFALASALQARHAYPAAANAYRTATEHARAADDAVVEMLSTVGLAAMAFEHGRLQMAQELTEPATARAERSGRPPPISGVLYGVLADVHYQRCDVEKGWQAATRARQLSTLGGYNSGRIYCRVIYARLAQLEGDLERADGELREAAGLIQGPVPDYIRQELTAQQVRLHLACGQPDAARLYLEKAGLLAYTGAASAEPTDLAPIPAERPLTHAAGLLYNSGLRFVLYQARHSGDQAGVRPAVAWADALVTAATAGQYMAVLLEALLLRAQLRALLGNPQATRANADYARALELAKPERFLAPFVEQGPPVAAALANLAAQGSLGDAPAAAVERIVRLNGLSSQQPDGGAVESLVEPLSQRELEVLSLIAAGLKYKEIAARLTISLNTVRFHVKAIYGKLGVNNRTRAVEAARRRHIL